MTDLIKRLRAGHQYSGMTDPVEIEAADRIEVLEAALKPFVFGDPAIEKILFGGMDDNETGTVTIKLGDLRRARAAINP